MCSPHQLSADLIQHFRDLLAIHADDPSLGACPVCLETRCWDWRQAWEQLTGAGELQETEIAGLIRRAEAGEPPWD